MSQVLLLSVPALVKTLQVTATMRLSFTWFTLPSRRNAPRVLRFSGGSRSMTSSAGPIERPVPYFLAGEEPLSEYRPGGYHPTEIGDILNERYQIQRKLGWGGYSTVWLARDKKTDEYRSIKILTDIASNSPELHELEYLQHLAKYDPMHPGYSRVIHLFDHFYHSGPYGRHLCLVTEVLCESVLSLARYTRLRNIHPVVAKGITRQVLQGVDYIHKSGIIHTDLKLDNFLVEIDDMKAYVHRALESSSPEVYDRILTDDDQFITYTISTPLAIPFEDVKNFRPVKVKIADLGVACWSSKTTENFTDQVQPPALRAPEVWVGAGWNSKCDIWSLGLLVLEMLRGRSLVPPKDTGDEGSLVIKVFFLSCFFGKFPLDLLERGKYSAKYFKPDGSFLYDFPEAATVTKWDADLNGYKNALHPDEFSNLMSFLEAALRLRPEDRPTAEELLSHDWINSETRFLET